VDYVEEDDIEVTLKGGKLLFPKELFEFLFLGEEFCVFNYAIGRRFPYNGFIFIELKESSAIKIESEESEEKIHPGTYSITKDNSGNTSSCFFVNDEIDISYPSEIVPFFVAQLQSRLNKSFTNFPENFLHHFKPIKYAIRIEQDKNNLLIKLLYKLAAELGLIENKIDECNKISIKSKSIGQDLANILAGISNENSQNLLPLNCFISAASNTNPYYRFLDIYHIFESLFYKHFYYYVKNYPESISKKSYDDIKGHTREEKMLKLVLIDILKDNEKLRNEIKNDLIKYCANELLKRIIGRDISVEKWPTDNKNADDFCDNLAVNLIYKLRNAITHSKRTEDYIEKINEKPNLTENFINVTNVITDISKRVIDKNIDNW
jgi:hypothetical protein